MTSILRILPIVLVCGALARAGAQEQPATAPAPALSSADSMMPYADYSFGFELKLPQGWIVDRTRFKGPGGATGLMRAQHGGSRATAQILIFRPPPPATDVSPDQAFVDWLVEFQKSLANISGTTKIIKDYYTVGRRGAATITVEASTGGATAGGGGLQTKSYYLCVPFDPGTVFVLLCAGPAISEEDALLKRDFDLIAASLNVLYEPGDAEKVNDALRRGKELLSKLRESGSSIQPDEREHFYDITLDGTSIGYLSRKIFRESRNLDQSGKHKRTKDGLHVTESSWRFPADGSVRNTQIELFASFDQESEIMSHMIRQFPAPDMASAGLLIKLDECVREGDVLFSSFTNNKDTSLPDPRAPIRLGPDYLGAVWLRLLPGMLPPDAHDPFAFSVYDSATRALVMQSMRAAGERPLPGSGGKAALTFEVREGFSKEGTTIFADPRGTALRVESGKLVLIETPREKVERAWAAKREAAEQLVKATAK